MTWQKMINGLEQSKNMVSYLDPPLKKIGKKVNAHAAGSIKLMERSVRKRSFHNPFMHMKIMCPILLSDMLC